MEKIISVEERIRRAEEIYNNRINNRENGIITSGLKNKANEIKLYKIKKMFIQIVVCFLLYAAFYIISNNNYIFTNDFKECISSLLNTQVDFDRLFSEAKNYFSELFSTNNGENVDKSDNKEEFRNEIKEESQNNEVENNNSVDSTNTSGIEDINIGGAEVENENFLNTKDKENNEQEKTQMEIDAEEIKNSISFQIPVEGYVSSTFGLRSPTTNTVPKNHTGLDIAATVGTVIKSATDGTIVLASSYGDYGKHYKIQIDDVIIIYAHCKELYFKEGDTVKQGQEIAEVGSTGNSTGPHLHFEIRKDGRVVDPQLILDI